LMKAMRESSRTFELFEIARLFLSKPDRFVAKVLPRGSLPANPSHKKPAPQAPQPTEQIFHISIPDGIGFETENEAIDHVLGNHLDKFFDIEKVEKEPPKGTFNVVNRCTLTDTLLAPPNYHRYQHIVQEHFTSKIHAMAFERFESKIETVRDQEAVDQWVESMKTGYTYKAKDTGENFQHLEEARRYLLMNHKAKIVRTAESIRIDGKDLEKLPRNRIRRSIEAVLEKQLRVPLDFSNHLRGRLRRANFTIYKRGGKGGVTYVCAVKRQHRTQDTAFSDSIQTLVEFIEKNPEVYAQHILKTVPSTQKEAEAKPAAPEPVETPESAPEQAETSAEQTAPATEDKPEESDSTETPATADAKEEPATEEKVETQTEPQEAPASKETKATEPEEEPQTFVG